MSLRILIRLLLKRLGQTYKKMRKEAKITVNRSINEYQSLSDSEFIHALYRDILERHGDPEGVAHHLERLKNRMASRMDTLEVFLNSEEYRLQCGESSKTDEVILSPSLTPAQREELYHYQTAGKFDDNNTLHL